MPHSCFALNGGGVLFGMTSEGGTKGLPTGNGVIFSFDPQTGTYTRLYSFDGKQHGSDPHGQPIFDPDGVTIYGMTREGGKHNVGVIFSLGSEKKCNPLSICNKIKVLHHFACPQNATPTCIDGSDGAPTTAHSCNRDDALRPDVGRRAVATVDAGWGRVLRTSEVMQNLDFVADG